jgi:hypothetical protein
MSQPLDTIQWARQLIQVPILHSPADMGTMAEKLAAAYVARFGREHWREFVAAIEGFWRNVRAGLERLELDYRQVDLYQDGLPVCGREMEIVQRAGAMGGENYQLLLDLLAKGATLMGTEDPNLLLREYRSVQAGLEGVRDSGIGIREETAKSPLPRIPDPVPADARRGEPRNPDGQTLSDRDAYIGRRIDQSLRPGRIGILFLGMTHNVESFLPEDIVVRRLESPG